MSAIYILSDWGKLSKRNETIVYSQADETSTILFPFKTEHLVLIGNISISGDALKMLCKYRIPLTLLSKNGKFNGRLDFGESKNVFLRKKQYAILDNEKQSLEIARSIVVGKIKNQLSFMQRIKRKNNSDESRVQTAIKAIKNNLQSAEITSDIEKLRGFEGIAAKHYFEVFGFNITPTWAEFKRRSKNPPKSNVNAVLSFLYTLLLYRIESAIEAEGLDIMVGSLHTLNYGKNALAFDLVEEFRCPIADSVCCSLFNLGTMSEDDFESKDFSQDSEDFPYDTDEGIPENEARNGILATEFGLKKIIKGFEEKINSQVIYGGTNQKMSYAKIIYEQVKHYKRVVSGEETEYKAFYFK